MNEQAPDVVRLEMTSENELRIYCFSLRLRDNLFLPREPLPTRGIFYLAYSFEGVHQGVHERFGSANMDIILHGDVPLREILGKVNLPQSAEASPPRPTDPPPGEAQTPEQRRERFVNGLQLLADRFLEPDDRNILLDVLSRVK